MVELAVRFEVEPFFPRLGCIIPSAISTEPLSMCIVLGLGLDAAFGLIFGVGFSEPIMSDLSKTLP
jgi:hypothetical protein